MPQSAFGFYAVWHIKRVREFRLLLYTSYPRMFLAFFIIGGAAIGAAAGAGLWLANRNEQRLIVSSPPPTSLPSPKSSGEIIDARHRRLSQEQKEQLVKILTPHRDIGASSGTVKIRYRVHDYEAMQYAGEFRDALRSIGWHCELQPLDYPAQVPDGLNIAVRGMDQVIPSTAPILADALANRAYSENDSSERYSTRRRHSVDRRTKFLKLGEHVTKAREV